MSSQKKVLPVGVNSTLSIAALGFSIFTFTPKANAMPTFLMGTRCNNSALYNVARVTSEGKLATPGGYSLRSVSLQGTFYPSGGKSMIPQFAPGKSVTFKADADISGTQRSAAVSGRVIAGLDVRIGRQTLQFRKEWYPIQSAPCNPPGGSDEIAQPPSPPSGPRTVCIRYNQFGYCAESTIIYAARENLIASSTAYPEPQLAELNFSESKIALGEYKGSSWTQSQKTD